VLLEARAFWRNMLGALPEGGLLIADSPSWIALRPDRQYGFPGTRVRTHGDGLLTMMAIEVTTDFGEAAEEIFMLAPVSMRGTLLAADLASAAGADRYAEAWKWINLGEGLAEGLRIGAVLWWQRRLLGAVAGRMFLKSHRGRQLAPGAAAALEAWGWFITRYFRRAAVSLSEAAAAPPSGRQYEILELDARLLNMGGAIWDRYGVGAFGRLRGAWPSDARFDGLDEMLEALWEQMPEMRLWEATLLDPQGDGGG